MNPRQRLKYAIKVTVAYGLYYVGLLQLWQRVVLRQRAVVLMYHRVLTKAERAATASHPALVVDRETFARQMAVLKRRFVVLSVDQFADHLSRKIPLPDSSCVITFDDGWHDNFTNALPILAEHQLPALVFLPMNYIGSRRVFWQEALTHLLVRMVMAVRQEPARRAHFERLLAGVGLAHSMELTVAGDPRPALRAIVDAQKRLTRPVVESLVSELANALDVRLEDLGEADGFMDWAQVETMGSQGVAFGSHGVEHLLLTQVSAHQADREIRESKEVLDLRFSDVVPTFSYPNGYCSADLVERVKASGYKLAFITRRGFVGCDDDPLTIRRLNIHEGVTNSAPMFLARIVGLL